MELKKYRVIGNGNVKHDESYYEVGDILTLTAEQAAPLLAINRLEETVQDITPRTDQSQPDGFPAQSQPAQTIVTDQMTATPPSTPETPKQPVEAQAQVPPQTQTQSAQTMEATA